MDISVIIPSHNSENTIARAIDSIDIDCEIILVADNCNDKTVEIAKSMLRNLTIIEGKYGDPGLARQNGVLNATNNFIAFLDSDDEFNSGKLVKQMNYMTQNSVDFTCTNYHVKFEKSSYYYIVKPRKLIDRYSLLKNCDIGNSTVMIKKSLLPNNFPTRPKEDYQLWLRILEKHEYCYGIDLNGTKYYRSSEQDSSNYMNNYLEKIKIYKMLQINFFKIVWFLAIDLFFQVKRRFTKK